MTDSHNETPAAFDFESEMRSLVHGVATERAAITARRPEIAALNQIIETIPVEIEDGLRGIVAPEPEMSPALFRLDAPNCENAIDDDIPEDPALMQARSRISFLEEENARFSRDVETLRQSLNHAHAENETIANALNVAREKSKRTASETERRLAESADALSGAMAQISEKEILLETASARLGQTDEALAAAQSRIAELESFTKSAQSQIDALSATVEDLENANATLVRDLDSAFAALSQRDNRITDLIKANNDLLERARRAGYELVGARGVVEAGRRTRTFHMLPDGMASVAPSALHALSTALDIYDRGRDASFVLDDANAEVEAARGRAAAAENGLGEVVLRLDDAERRAASAEARAADRFAQREFELKKSVQDLQELFRHTGAMLSKMQEWQPYAETLEQDANAAMAEEIQNQRRQVSVLRDVRTRAEALAAAVGAGLDADHGSIKRAWLRFMTGRDEPVESKSFAELHEIVARFAQQPAA